MDYYKKQHFSQKIFDLSVLSILIEYWINGIISNVQLFSTFFCFLLWHPGSSKGPWVVEVELAQFFTIHLNFRTMCLLSFPDSKHLMRKKNTWNMTTQITLEKCQLEMHKFHSFLRQLPSHIFAVSSRGKRRITEVTSVLILGF